MKQPPAETPCAAENAAAPEAKARCPVVGIGASAGGLDAFKRFFESVPADSGMVFVLIQHLSPDYPSIIPELLGKHTTMPVMHVLGDTEVEVNHVYVIPPDAVLSMKDCVLKVAPPTEAHGHRFPIDHFFRSLAEDQTENSVAVIFSGAGSDGALGLQAVKKHGGLVLVQDPQTCRYDSMPRAAIATGMVDHVLPVEDMPSKLITFFEFRERLLQMGAGAGVQTEVLGHLGRICSLLRKRLGHDLSRYKQSTLVRRIERRMQMHRISPVSAYVTLLEENAEEAEALFKDLLIGVTQFFRDREAFDQLARRVLPTLFTPGETSTPVRVWVPGCASGQEAYSIAILLHEYRLRTGLVQPVQIFATDIDEEALDVARAGTYSDEILEQVSRERLERYFSRHGEGYRVAKEIREMCIFSLHNLTADAPFSRMDLISCRNLLIYFEAALQEKVVTIFQYSLKPDGHLFLGPAESLGAHGEAFTEVDKRLRLFRARPNRTRVAVRLPRVDGARTNRVVIDSSLKMRAVREADAQSLHERCILEQYAPPSVLVDGDGEILHFVRQTSKYLEPPVGVPTHNIFDVVRSSLRLPLRAAVHQARTTSRPTVRNGVEVEVGPEVQQVSLIVHPLVEGGETPERFVIIFHEEGSPRLKEATDDPPVLDPRMEGAQVVLQLEKELRTTKEWLQSAIEELESSNEELKSSNEELISINEEYESAHESLQSSKEELQSLNEELETVNNELSKKVEELDRANADLVNLFVSTRIATIFLDPEFRIKRFTPAATSLFNLIDGDVGRPLLDLVARFETEPLFAEIRAVNGGAAPHPLEVYCADSRLWFSVRVHQYRTWDELFEGVVVNFIDITELKTAEESLTEALHDNQRLHEIGLAFAAEKDLPQLMQKITDAATAVTRAQFAAFFYHAENDDGEAYLLNSLSGARPSVFENFAMTQGAPLFAHTFSGSGPIRSADITQDPRYREHAHRSSNGHLPAISYLAVPVISRKGEVLGGLFFGHQESGIFTQRAEELAVGIAALAASALDNAQMIDTLRRTANTLELSQQHFRLLADAMPQIVWTARADGSTDYFNQRWYEFTGLREGQVEEKDWTQVLHPDDHQLCLDTWYAAVRSQRPYEIRYRFRHAATGEYRWQLGRALPVTDREGKLMRWFGTCTDIDDLVRAEKALQEAAKRKDEFLAMLGHELRNPLAPIQNGLRILDLPDTPSDTEAAVKQMLQRQARHLARLVDDLLDVSRVSRNKILLRREIVDLTQLARSAVEDHQEPLNSSQLKLHVMLPDEPVWVHGDPTRLCQAISNLIHNACKFTEPGGEVAILLEPKEAQRAVLTVRDSGIGIAPEIVETLFEPFTQADNSLERSRGGLGLGLALVRGLVELHGGTVSAESDGLGAGSTFRMELPITDSRPAAAPPKATGSGASRRIVLVEDNQDAARTLSHLLRRRGHEVEVAHSGLDGLDLVRRTHPDVLVCDIGLPGAYDGYRVARQLRSELGSCPPLLIALTGYGQAEDQKNATAAGFDVHLTKPVDLDVLESVIASLGGGNSAGTAVVDRFAGGTWHEGKTSEPPRYD